MECTGWLVTTPLRRAPTTQEGFFPPPTNRDPRGTKIPQSQEVHVFISVMMSVNASLCSMFSTGEKCFFLQGKSVFVKVKASYNYRGKPTHTGTR